MAILGLFFALLVLLGYENTFASSDYVCFFKAKVTDVIRSPENKIRVGFKVQRRTLGTWILRYSFCKNLVGSSAVTSDFDFQAFDINFEAGTDFEVKGTQVCSENGDDFNCYLIWLPAE